MKTLNIFVVLLIIFALTVNLGSQEKYSKAGGGTMSGADIGNKDIMRWESMPVTWYINADNIEGSTTEAGAQSKIKAGYDKWENVATADIYFQYSGTTSDSWGDDGKNIHLFPAYDNSIYTYQSSSYDNSSWLAVTIWTAYEDDGEITDVDIIYNEKYHNFGGNLDRIPAHEIGHKIGFQHNSSGSVWSAVMVASTQTTVLKDPDIRAVSFLYGGLVQQDITTVNPVYIEWDWEMASNVSFDIDYGQVYISPDVTLTVNGSFSDYGSNYYLEDDSKIILKGDVDISTCEFSQKSGSPGRWKGIEISNYPNSTTNSIYDTDIFGAEIGLHLNNAQNVFYERSIFDDNNIGIKVTSGQDNEFYRNEIKNSNGNGIEITNSADVELHKNKINNNDGEGISITGSSPLVHYNNLDNNSINGIVVSSYSSPDIEYNRIVNSAARGVLIISNSTPQLKYNLIEKNDVHGVTALLNCPVYFFHNTIYDNTYDGIQASTDSDIDGSSNEMLSNSQYGISAYSSTAVDFYYALNSIADNTSYELYADANSSIDAVGNFFDTQHNDYSGNCNTTGYLASASTGVGCSFDYNEDPTTFSVKTATVNTPILVNYNAATSSGQSLEESIDQAIQSNSWKSVRRNVSDYTKQLIRGKRPAGAYNSILKNRNANSIPIEIKRKIRMLSVLHDVVLDKNYKGALSKLDDLMVDFPENRFHYLAQKVNLYINELEDASSALEVLGELYSVDGVDDEIKSLLLGQLEKQLNDKLGIEANPALFVKNVSTENKAVPSSFILSQNYPNPFNPVTSIRYALPESQHVTLRVFNITGQLVAELVNKSKSAGYHDVQWDASNVASGVYIYTISAGSFSETKRMVVMK